MPIRMNPNDILVENLLFINKNIASVHEDHKMVVAFACTDNGGSIQGNKLYQSPNC